ncbi:MAG: hypothetical protein ACFE9T_16115 [Promethearchaeota archaeon]
MQNLKLEQGKNIFILIPEEAVKLDEEEKPKMEQIKAESKNYAKYHEEKINIDKLKAKLDAKIMSSFYLRMY